MVVIPDTDIILLKCELKLDNKNQLTFTDATAQYNYFSSLPKLELENATYQRKNGAIRYNGNFDDLLQYNYCMYRNSNYSSKWFYAFITGMEYLNDECTMVYIITDVFQTWQFDLVYKASFIEREHIANDTVGANLLPEGLEIGEYKIGGTASVSDLEPVFVFAYSEGSFDYVDTNNMVWRCGSGVDTSTTPVTVTPFYGSKVNGIPQTVTFIATKNATQLDQLRKSWLLSNQSEKVVAFFTIPYAAAKSLMVDANRLQYLKQNTSPYIGYIDNIFVLNGDATAQSITLTSTPSSIDGYTPHNKKLLTYPYVYLAFNSPFGTNKIFRYEDFTSGTPSFSLISEVNPNPTLCLIPQNYRGTSGNDLSDTVYLNGYPQLSTKVDFYNSWLAENSGVINVQTQQQYYNTKMGVAGDTVGLVGGLASLIGALGRGDMGGMISGGVSAIQSMAGSELGMYQKSADYDFYTRQLMATVDRQQLLPDPVTMGGSNATLVGYGLIDDNIFTKYNIKEQFARRIDSFFDMYGYATNELKIPEIDSRPYWNYVKTQGINLEGDIPEQDLAEIRSLFDNGVTLWHDATKYLDYSQNNAPVTP